MGETKKARAMRRALIIGPSVSSTLRAGPHVVSTGGRRDRGIYTWRQWHRVRVTPGGRGFHLERVPEEIVLK